MISNFFLIFNFQITAKNFQKRSINLQLVTTTNHKNSVIRESRSVLESLISHLLLHTIMPSLPFLPAVTFVVAFSTYSAVYFLFDEENSTFKGGVTKVVEPESSQRRVLSSEGLNETYEGVHADPDMLVTVIDTFCRVCYSGDL